MSSARVRMVAAGAAGVLGGGLFATGVLAEPWCASLGVLCLAWLAVLVWLEEE